MDALLEHLRLRCPYLYFCTSKESKLGGGVTWSFISFVGTKSRFRPLLNKPQHTSAYVSITWSFISFVGTKRRFRPLLNHQGCASPRSVTTVTNGILRPFLRWLDVARGADCSICRRQYSYFCASEASSVRILRCGFDVARGARTNTDACKYCSQYTHTHTRLQILQSVYTHTHAPANTAVRIHTHTHACKYCSQYTRTHARAALTLYSYVWCLQF
jgi:hypothetical protein